MGEWEDVRRDYPALERYTYLDSAAAGPLSRPVHETVQAFYRELEDEGDGPWTRWLRRREQAREVVARLVGADADEIAFVENTSTGINLVVDLVGDDGPVLSDELEFPTVTLPWVHRGIPVHFVPAKDGCLALESLSTDRAPQAATLALSHVQFSNGFRLDLEAVGRLKAGRHLVVSASQSAGVFPIDVKRSGVDALASAGHKWLCAGYGAGFVFIDRRLLQARQPRAIGWLSVEDPFEFDNAAYRLRSHASRTEMGCPNFAGCFALGAAAEYVLALGIERIAERVLQLNTYLTSRLEDAGFDVLSPGGVYRSGETLVATDDGYRAFSYLRERGVRVTPKPEGIRIATHFFNDERDLDTCIRVLDEYRAAQGS